MKKPFALIMALAMVLCLFSACTQNTDPPKGNQYPTDVPPISSDVDDKTVVLRSVGPGTSETVTYYFINGVYCIQRNIAIYPTEEAAADAYRIVKDKESWLEGTMVTFDFVSPVFEGKSRSEVFAYWKDLIDNDAVGFYKGYTVTEE